MKKAKKFRLALRKAVREVKAFLLFSILLLAVGCAYLGPAYLPEVTRDLYVDTMGHEPPNFKGFTVSGVLKATDKELDFRKQEYILKWTFTKKLNTGLINFTDTVSNGALGLMAMLGPVGAAVALKMGKGMKRDTDATEEEVAALKLKYGLMDPEEARADILGG